jgi:hypothetical protein
MGLDRLSYHGNYVVAIWEDVWVRAHLFTSRQVMRQRQVRVYTTHLHHLDPPSLLDVLIEQTRWNHLLGRETDLAAFSMDVWDPAEYADRDRGGEPLLAGWRYTPETHQTEYGTVSA